MYNDLPNVYKWERTILLNVNHLNIFISIQENYKIWMYIIFPVIIL